MLFHDVRVSEWNCLFKASVHSFKSFTSQLLKLHVSFSLSMHLLPRMNGMLDFIWTMPVQLQERRNKWTLQKNLVHGRIRPTNTIRPPDCKSTVIITRPQLAWYEMELNVHAIYIYTIFNSTSKGACIYRINTVSVFFYFSVTTYEYYKKSSNKIYTLINLQNNTDVTSR